MHPIHHENWGRGDSMAELQVVCKNDLGNMLMSQQYYHIAVTTPGGVLLLPDIQSSN